MKPSRKIGAVTMVVAAIMSFALLAISDGWLTDFDLFRTVMGNLWICLASEEVGTAYARSLLLSLGVKSTSVCTTMLPTKYPLLLCVIAFGAGLLLLCEVIPLPGKKNRSE